MNLRIFLVLFVVCLLLTEISAGKKKSKKSREVKKRKEETVSESSESTEGHGGKGGGGQGMGAAEPDVPEVIKVGKQLAHNVVAVLMSIAHSVEIVQPRVIQAAHEFVRAISEDILAVAEALAYVPEFLIMEAPQQFMSSLNFIAENYHKIFKHDQFDLKSAIKVLQQWVEEAMSNGAQAGMNFVSIFTFWGSILKNFKHFYRTSLDSLFKPIEV